MIVDYGTRTIGLKIVFFGPAMSGKTTSIKWLFKSLDCADRLTSIENTVGRTMFCDFGSIPFTLGDSWTINTHVWSATGQDFYRSTREVVLVGSDGIIFVADSQKSLLDENLASWNELMDLMPKDEHPLPVVVCLNKQDLPDAIDEDRFRRHLKIPPSIPIIRSVAMNGINVVEAFERLFHAAMKSNAMMSSAR